MAKAIAEELFAEEVENVVEEPYIHTMIRSISTTAIPLEGTMPWYEVDKEVGDWVQRGYRLVNTHFLGQDPNGFMFAYILSK